MKTGFTTGTCAAAAARAALHTLVTGTSPPEVELGLPDGSRFRFVPEECEFSGSTARCCVRKDAGDDPDVTDGMLVCCRVQLDTSLQDGEVLFFRGEGVGLVTLPGLGIEVGGPAINPVPRAMVRQAVAEVMKDHGVKGGVNVTVSIPGGEEIARKTLNERVGVTGGLSIIGTSGRVIPYSEEAYLESVARMLRVARHACCGELVLTAGVRSEQLLRPLFPSLPDTAFLHYGNRIGSVLKLLRDEEWVRRVTVGVMLAKATKLAAGEPDLSSRTVELDREFISSLVRDAGYGEDIISRAGRLQLVRSLVDIIPFSANEPFYRLLAERCWGVCSSFLPPVELRFVLLSMENGFIDHDGVVCRDIAL
ncbi:MAG: cobalt-precorrin-5B (C(1))-methyltransferase [Prosthecochloris sp.]|nr:cobalt-precorrin-5B (C(1))-methyltransferase [Prosthecochloris sp.]